MVNFLLHNLKADPNLGRMVHPFLESATEEQRVCQSPPMGVQLPFDCVVNLDAQRTSEDGATPLYISAKLGNLEIVNILLAEPGIDVCA